MPDHDHDQQPVDPTEPISGPYGNAHHCPLPEPDTIQTGERGRAANQLTVCQYLVTAPIYHPVWSQYALSVCRLDEHPALPEPVLKFAGATHELMLFALNPHPERCEQHDHRDIRTAPHAYTVEDITGYCRTGTLPFLTPVNIAEQFECTDDEIREVAWLACRAVCHGLLNPETGDAPTAIRESWLQACTKTLAHIRGEAHAS